MTKPKLLWILGLVTAAMILLVIGGVFGGRIAGRLADRDWERDDDEEERAATTTGHSERDQDAPKAIEAPKK